MEGPLQGMYLNYPALSRYNVCSRWWERSRDEFTTPLFLISLPVLLQITLIYPRQSALIHTRLQITAPQCDRGDKQMSSDVTRRLLTTILWVSGSHDTRHALSLTSELKSKNRFIIDSKVLDDHDTRAI